jgi:hypothetical protein
VQQKVYATSKSQVFNLASHLRKDPKTITSKEKQIPKTKPMHEI